MVKGDTPSTLTLKNSESGIGLVIKTNLTGKWSIENGVGALSAKVSNEGKLTITSALGDSYNFTSDKTKISEIADDINSRALLFKAEAKTPGEQLLEVTSPAFFENGTDGTVITASAEFNSKIVSADKLRFDGAYFNYDPLGTVGSNSSVDTVDDTAEDHAIKVKRRKRGGLVGEALDKGNFISTMADWINNRLVWNKGTLIFYQLRPKTGAEPWSITDIKAALKDFGLNENWAYIFETFKSGIFSPTENNPLISDLDPFESLAGYMNLVFSLGIREAPTYKDSSLLLGMGDNSPTKDYDSQHEITEEGVTVFQPMHETKGYIGPVKSITAKTGKNPETNQDYALSQVYAARMVNYTRNSINLNKYVGTVGYQEAKGRILTYMAQRKKEFLDNNLVKDLTFDVTFDNNNPRIIHVDAVELLPGIVELIVFSLDVNLETGAGV
jgi:hypothetical protein